ncbi:MAG TPA: hypothetical protein VJ998_03000 [Pseudomonadales bacterium]|nr:hypothetical protein [Pseudomonadales bacterium]
MRLSKLLIVGMFLILGGCTTTVGGYAPQSNFTYPNSNVVPLGQVEAHKSFTGFFVPHFITAKDVEGVMQQALSQKPDAALLVNYKTDTSLTTLGPFYRTTLSVRGTAVSMEVGQQDLH